MPDEAIWLIWSNEHRAWWGPGSMGYVGIIEKAGRYSFRTAKEICDGANRYLPEGKTHEVMTLSPEASKKLMDAAATTPAEEITAYPPEQDVRPGQWFRPGVRGEEDRKFNVTLRQISDALKPHGLELCNDAEGNYSVRVRHSGA